MIWIFKNGHFKQIGKNRETMSEKFFIGNNRETILGEFTIFRETSGNDWFLKLVTVNRSGKIGKRFVGFFLEKIREIPRNDLNFGPISRGKNLETKRETPI